MDFQDKRVNLIFLKKKAPRSQNVIYLTLSVPTGRSPVDSERVNTVFTTK